MKAWSGTIELLIIVFFTIASIPLMVLLIYLCEKSKFNYLEDKSIYSSSGSDIWQDSDGSWYPSSILPINLDYASMQFIAYCQDDYCPDEAKGVTLAFEQDKIDEMIGSNKKQYELDITRGWEGIRGDRLRKLINSLNTVTDKSELYDSKFYIVYNYKEKRWMITRRKISIFTK